MSSNVFCFQDVFHEKNHWEKKMFVDHLISKFLGFMKHVWARLWVKQDVTKPFKPGLFFIIFYLKYGFKMLKSVNAVFLTLTVETE